MSREQLKWARRPLMVLLVGAGLVAGSTGSASAAPEHHSSLPALRVGISFDIASLDPTKVGTVGFPASMFNDLAYDGIFRETAKGKIVPGLALRWHYFSTGRGPNKDFEFTLRKNARFSDGTPVTASAVVGWLRYFSQNGVGYSSFLGPNPQFQAVGKWTVRLRLSVPTPNLPLILSNNGWNSWGFVPSLAVLSNPTQLATSTAGAGPYVLEPDATVKGDHYTYVPNPYYFDKSRIKWSQIFIKVIPSPSSLLQAIESGQVDAAQGDISTGAAAKSAGLGVAFAPSMIESLLLNAKADPDLRDVRVRQAINYAIDRKTAAAGLFGTFGSPTSQLLLSDVNPGLSNYYPYNPAKAKALLAAAGHPTGIKLHILSIVPAIAGPAGDPLVQALANNLEAAGIHPDITPATATQWLANYKTSDVVESGTAINITPKGFSTYVAPVAAFNLWGLDPTIYKLYYAGLHAKNPISDWKQMWARFTKQAYIVPMVKYGVLWYHTNAVTGVPQSVTVTRPSAVLLTDWGHK